MADPRYPPVGPLTPDMDATAGELALGFLEGTDRLEAERLRLENPDFAAAVAAWEMAALSWIDEQPAEEPSAGMWPRIEASLARRPIGVPVPAHSPEVIAPPVASALPVPANDPGPWKPFALAASLAAVVFGGLWMFAEPTRVEVPVEQPLGAQMLSVAQINGAPEQGALLSALYDRKTGKLYLRLAELPDSSRVPELWLLDDTGTPRSIGFGQRDAVSELQLTPEQQANIEASGTIAVSLEQPAAIPHETPTDVLGAASLAPLTDS